MSGGKSSTLNSRTITGNLHRCPEQSNRLSHSVKHRLTAKAIVIAMIGETTAGFEEMTDVDPTGIRLFC